MAQELRQRGKKKKQKSKPKKNGANPQPDTKKLASAPPTNAATDAKPQDETLWQTFSSHPLVQVAPVILIPYLIYISYYFFTLKRPDIISTATLGLINLRPAVRLHESRQVLVLGSMGSGTLQLASALSQIMRLEITHETSDAENHFARDGTVSNFLGLRYVDKQAFPPEASARVISDLCVERGKGSENALQPKNFQPTTCSEYVKWSTCHSKECLDLISNEWGCGLIEDGCRTHFVKVLHLVQHPLRTIPELMAKVCPGAAKTVHPAFRQLANVFLDDSGADNCLAPVAWYVIRYNNALLQARKAGRIDAMIQYEQVSLCDVVELAGFLDPQLVVYEPNLDKLTKQCNDSGANVNQRLPTLVTKVDEERKLPKYSWEDYQAAGGSKLVSALRKLCQELGYNPDKLDADEFGA